MSVTRFEFERVDGSTTGEIDAREAHRQLTQEINFPDMNGFNGVVKVSYVLGATRKARLEFAQETFDVDGDANTNHTAVIVNHAREVLATFELPRSL